MLDDLLEELEEWFRSVLLDFINANLLGLFTDVNDIVHPYGPIGLLRIKNLKPQRDILKRGVQQARKFAASKGADAILLAQYNNAENEVRTPTITLIVYVYKYGDNLTEADIQAMRDFEVEGALNNSIYRPSRRDWEHPEFFVGESLVKGGKQPYDFGNVAILVNRRPE